MHRDWQAIQAHFEALCDLPPAQQAAALEALELAAPLREQLIELLAFDQDTGLDDLAAEVVRFSARLDQDHMLGHRLGPYRLVRSLGEGGMGEVYLAERADGRFEARVAIKFLAIRGARGQRLFDRERRILARLGHPAIARLLDAGEHPKLGAWLVMEYVEGEPVHQLVRQRAVGPRERIGWMVEAARAVSSAHQNLVLHRDIKPDHLLIDRAGQLKILDFGVATLISGQSLKAERTESASFTPRYAAPEQILNQPTTTATDVYALGLVLHELLSDGRGPFGDDPNLMSEAKLAGRLEPLPAQTELTPGQQRDLQAVLNRCLARRPEDRYQGAGNLAADLSAILDDQPVSARRPAGSEQLLRWIRHYRLASAALLIALLAIIGGSGLSAWHAQSARLERNAAVQEAAKAQAVTEFLESIFASSSPGIEAGPETTVRELLDRGAERIGQELEDQTEVRGYLALAIARSYMFLGLYDEALGLLESDRDGEHPAARWNRLGLTGRIKNLKGHYGRTVELLEPLLQEPLPPNQRAEVLMHLATAQVNLGQLDAAERAAREAASVAGQDEDGLDWQASAHNMLGVVAYNRGDLDAAREAFTDLYQTYVRLHGETHGTVGLALNNLATVALYQGDPAAALAYAERAVAALIGHYQAENRSVGMALRTLGMAYRHLGQHEQADASFRRALSVLEHWGGRNHSIWRLTLIQLAELEMMIGREEEVGRLLDELLPLERIEWQVGEQLTACRLQRLALALGVVESPGPYCPSDLEDLPQSRAMVLYLAARQHALNGDGQFDSAVQEAEDFLHQLKPPDPLLEQAFARLKSSLFP